MRDDEARGKEEKAREKEKENKNASVKGTLFPHERL